MQQAQLLRAGLKDLQAIRSLAQRIWNQYYPTIISSEQIGFMLEMMYSIPSLTSQMQDLGHEFYLISRAGEQPFGFISLNRENQGAWFINKFYIDQGQAGRGIGSAVFAQILDMTRAQEFRLTVNRQNFRAVNFYFRNGFRIERVADFDIGNGYFMNDFVMVWKREQG